MAGNRRIERLNVLIQQVVSEQITQYLSDPRIGFVTITRVELAPDLSVAKVYFSVLGDETDVRTTLRGLKSAARELRGVVGNEVRMRTVPMLQFEFDPSVWEAAEIDAILRREREERTVETGSPDASTPES